MADKYQSSGRSITQAIWANLTSRCPTTTGAAKRISLTPPCRDPRNPTAEKHLKTWCAHPDRVCSHLGRVRRVPKDTAHLSGLRVTQVKLNEKSSAPPAVRPVIRYSRRHAQLGIELTAGGRSRRPSRAPAARFDPESLRSPTSTDRPRPTLSEWDYCPPGCQQHAARRRPERTERARRACPHRSRPIVGKKGIPTEMDQLTKWHEAILPVKPIKENGATMAPSPQAAAQANVAIAAVKTMKCRLWLIERALAALARFESPDRDAHSPILWSFRNLQILQWFMMNYVTAIPFLHPYS